ncbi:MAG: universal stress protein [Acidobacteriota bacterium]|nr:universal stress protein [Acidobacteriota bacterium]
MLPTVKTILYCTQMGPNAPYVFRWAYALAKCCDARIHVLYVIEGLTPRQRAMVEGYSGHSTLSQVIEQAEAEAAERLPHRLEAFFESEAPDEDWRSHIGELMVARGKALEQILEHVESTGADLVVVGAHSSVSMVETIIGSTAQRLTEKCRVPVLVVRVPEGQRALTITDG